jgi:hypothetical protein
VANKWWAWLRNRCDTQRGGQKCESKIGVNESVGVSWIF